MRRLFPAALAAGLTVLCLPSCGLFGSSDDGPTHVDKLVTWVERVHVESELAKEKSQTAISSLEGIASGDFDGGAAVSYRRFVEAISQSERQAERLRQTVEPMQSAAESLFQKWQDNLSSFTNENMRTRSETRLRVTRDRYEAIMTAVQPALAVYDNLHKNLRDHALFLGNDLNPEAINVIQEDVRVAGQLATELDQSLAACMDATRAYVEQSALPSMPGGAAPDER